MEQFTALILSLVLMLSAANYPAGGIAEVSEAAAEQPFTMTIATDAVLHSSPSGLSKQVAAAKADSSVTVLATRTVRGLEWSQVRSGDITGWIPAVQLKEPEKEEVQPDEVPIPSWVSWATVNTSQLNIRTAPGVNNERIGVYYYGTRVPLLESNAGWYKTNKGWIAGNYLYFDGNAGINTMDGVVTANQLNIRKGPSTTYGIIGTLNKGDKVHVLEQFRYNGVAWGCTSRGWICMSYVEPETSGTVTSVVGYGLVKVEKADILSPILPNPVIGSLAKNDIIPVLKLVDKGGASWALTQRGWILASNLEILKDPVAPTDPTEPTTAPTEPTTAPTEPTTAPTEPTTAPTEPTTAPTEPTTAPTEPTAAPTEPTTAPTEPTAAPTEPTTAPTEPTTAPTEPTTAPTEPTTAPTEPTTAPTEPTTAPTEPTTAPTEPTA